jgi:protocatechuate 3,4-dioxygenase beta subunit
MEKAIASSREANMSTNDRTNDQDHTHGVDDIEDHDRGLLFDLQTLSRRKALGLMGAGLGASLFALVGCGSSSKSSAGSASTSAATTASSAASSAAASAATSATASATATGDASVTLIPNETAGPYPGDGSNGPNVLTQSGIVRSDIRSSFGSSTTTAKGVPLTVVLTIENTANGGKPIAGAAVYIWHCNIDGAYSMYDKAVSSENYLRGVQATDANGKVTFTSIFPAAYSGRWPHIHFEVYNSLTDATAASKIKATSQLALPKATCDLVYATEGYSASVKNMTQTSLASDNVFGNDSGVHQLATMTGSVAQGFTANLVVGV